MDFFRIIRVEKKDGPEICPEFRGRRSSDLMVRGGRFYAVWDEKKGLWSTDEYDVYRMIDDALWERANEIMKKEGVRVNVKTIESFSSGMLTQWSRFISSIGDNYHPLDNRIIFNNENTDKETYATKKLPYALEEGDHSAWDSLVGVLYSPEERAKIEWAIGSIIEGDSKDIQKFLVFYGEAGTGKSTIMGIIEKLFEGYTAVFDAKALTSNGGNFATEMFRNNPRVAIQHDGDLSRIEDNTRLNSIVSHEKMTINEKYKSTWESRIESFLFMGTNNPVKISDSRSGIIRRLIDVHPSGRLFSWDEYQDLMSQIQFELGAIAHHCHSVYLSMGKSYYNKYKPVQMMYSTNVFFNFVESYFDELNDPSGITLKRAWTLYKEFCEDSNNKPMQMQTFRTEMQAYYEELIPKARVDSAIVSNLFRGFKKEKVLKEDISEEPETDWIAFDKTESILRDILADQPAQIASEEGIPSKKWSNVTTTLRDIDERELHFVKVPENHIVIDFDLVGDDGEKSLSANLKALRGWVPTYAELSKSGQAVHLHYIYQGDPAELSNEYSKGIEIKTFPGNSSLRRKFTRSNNRPIASITSGLPKKENKRMLDVQTIQTEKGLRDLIQRNLRKEIHPGTKPSIDFIKKILDEVYEEGLTYDVTDLRSRIIAFANNSTNRPLECLKIVQQMKFKSEDTSKSIVVEDSNEIAFFDVEVYPNLFVVCWKYAGPDKSVVRMINPSPTEIESLFRLKLVGFNNRRYDNHILYARYLGYDNEALYELSQRIINPKDKSYRALFGEAYGLSYADIYEFSSKKQGLKKFQIELHLPHQEMDHPWDQPVPEEKWDTVVEYCVNDVITTEAVFENRKADFVARQILADISGLSVNDTTQKHTAKIIFGEDRNPQSEFEYVDLGEELFPGYVYESGVSSYRGENPSEGGYVYSEPGYYEDVVVLDISSMHPTSIIQLNLFGKYTRNFAQLVMARLAIKHNEWAEARRMLDGKLRPYLQNVDDTTDAFALSYALKIVINTVYGLTSAKFDNPFRDIRNKDNIVAKRGALFMIDLKHAVQERGFTVAHIKTDSIKIPNATDEIISFVHEFGSQYGYAFEHEITYDKFCLVNDAVYIARSVDAWTAVGAQFQHPYVYKTLFSLEDVTISDLAETKGVSKGAIYLDFNHEKPAAIEPGITGMHFIGRTGSFIPVVKGGGRLYRVYEGKAYALSGSKDYFWVETSFFSNTTHAMNPGLTIDQGYYDHLVDDAVTSIEKFVPFDKFIAEEK